MNNIKTYKKLRKRISNDIDILDNLSFVFGKEEEDIVDNFNRKLLECLDILDFFLIKEYEDEQV
jgi:hypothetical protein